mmetsp:Transcript_139681/g.254107  ORF Transcript_139681/g.254107 Transcript_139681/m.254107 type:complete len:295 (+) Transcript_139681:47-931(+)
MQCILLFLVYFLVASVPIATSDSLDLHDTADNTLTEVDAVALLQTRLTMEPAKKHTSAPCKDEGGKWLFILATGRTGSSSILRMVDQIPGVFLSGENGGMLSDLAALKEKGNRTDAQQVSVSWKHGAQNHEDILCFLRGYTRSIIGSPGFQPTMTGFKEVRHTTADELDVLLETFPDAKFIINTRKNITAQSISQAKLVETKDSLFNSSEEVLQQMTTELEEWGQAHSDRTFQMRVEDFSVELFNQMLAWLDVAPDCLYTDVLHVNEDDYSLSLSVGGTEILYPAEPTVIQCNS